MKIPWLGLFSPGLAAALSSSSESIELLQSSPLTSTRDATSPRLRPTPNEVWARTRHLYWDAPISRPASAAQLASLRSRIRVLRALSELDLDLQRSIMVASHCVHGGTGSHFPFSSLPSFYQIPPEVVTSKLDINFTSKVLTYTPARVGGFSTSWKFQNSQLGCWQLFNSHWSQQPFTQGAAGPDPFTNVEKWFQRNPLHKPSPWARLELSKFAAIKDFTEAELAAAGGLATHAVGLVYRGRAYEVYNERLKFAPSEKVVGWSMGKSILALLLLRRAEEKRLNLTEYCSHPLLGRSDAVRNGWTIQAMMSMTAGAPCLESTERMVSFVFNSSDVADWALTHGRLEGHAAGRWYYSSAMAMLLSWELKQSFLGDAPDPLRAASDEYSRYPWEVLFNHIGANFTLQSDATGTLELSSLIWGSVQDFLRVGELILNDGLAPDGFRVLGPESMRRLTSPPPDSDVEFYSHMWYHLHRLYGWDTPPALGCRGIEGQYLVAVPRLGLAVARFGLGPGSLDDTQGGGYAMERLLQRLDALESGRDASAW